MAERLAPEDIARASFGTVRRGYEPQEVRAFLHEVSSLVDRLTRTEKELREQLARAEARAGTGGEPDEAVLLEVLGAETTRVLTSARDAAAEIRSKAEEAAERIIAEATSEAAERRATSMREVESLVARMTAEAEELRDAAHNELELRRAEAHAASERLQEEGRQAAAALREEGEADLARAREEAAAIVVSAQQQGKEMVAEAQAVRERVLRDLAVRRKRARQQVEKLNAGRERLLAAYATVRATLDEATTELHSSITEARAAANDAARRVEDEPDASLEELDAEVTAVALGDLSFDQGGGVHEAGFDVDVDDDDDGGSGPLSGEVPTVGWPEEGQEWSAAATESPRTLTNLDERRGRKGRRKKGFEGLPPSELTVLEPPRPDEGVRVLADPAVDSPPPAVEPGDVIDDEAADTVQHQPDVAEALDPPAAPPAASLVGADDEIADEAAGEAADEAAEHGDATADDVFARLREQAEAAQVDDADPPADDAVEASPPDHGTAEVDALATDEQPTAVSDEETGDGQEVAAARSEFTSRASAAAPIEKELLKRLKRALADEQNEVLDLLRREKPKGVDDVLPSVDEHVVRWVQAAEGPLTDAATAGASLVGGKPGSVTSLAGELARDLVDPLRERIERSFAAADGDLDDVADRVRALYREWKGQRLTDGAENFVMAAYGRGVFDGIGKGVTVEWVIDVQSGACPDCEDNVLAGAITKGEEFPTGSPNAPAHPGCRCLVLPCAD